MKQGTNNHLAVKFEGLNAAEIVRVEFVFAQTKDGEPVVTHLYATGGVPGDVALDEDGVFQVPFSRGDTYLFRPGTTFFMDTRIRMSGNAQGDNPPTPIVALRMEPTLFAAVDGLEVSV